MNEDIREHIRRMIRDWRAEDITPAFKPLYSSFWQPGLKPAVKRKPFLTAKDIILLREMKVGL